MERVGIVVHPRRDLDGALASLRSWASVAGTEIVQIDMDGIDRRVAEPGSAATCDALVALGGDGTTLAALHAGGAAGKPVLGVACGSLGALTATSAADIGESLEALDAGDWHPRRLPGIAVSAGDLEPVVALNDFVVVRKGASQISVAVEVDGDLFIRFAGDGIVVATPLGSSAYTMAVGGPILAPGTQSIVLTALAPHGGTCPPLVVGCDAQLHVAVDPGYYGARIEVDGHVQQLPPHSFRIAWRPDYATLVTFEGGETLLDGLRRRRILVDSPRVLARDERAPSVTRR